MIDNGDICSWSGYMFAWWYDYTFLGVNDLNVEVKKMTSKGTSTSGMYVLVVVGLVLFEDVCHCEAGYWGFIYAQTVPSETDNILLSARQNVKHSATSLRVGLLVQHHVAALW